MRTRIGLAIEYPIMQRGGTETLVRELIRRLAPEFDIVLISPEETSNIPSTIGELLDGHIPLEKQHFTFSGKKQFAQKIRQKKLSYVHFHLGGTYGWETRYWHASPLAAMAGIGVPYYITTHGVFDFHAICGPRWPSWMRRLLQLYVWPSRAIITKRSQQEFLVSRNDQQEMQRWFWPLRAKFGQIYHSQLEGAPPPESERRRRILCVGTIGARKGQWILAEAFALVAAEYPDWELTIVGRNGDDVFYEKVVAAANQPSVRDRISLLSHATDEEIFDLYRTSEVFSMPSLMEGLGLSLQEAIFFGCVPVGSRIGGIPELIEDGRNGLLVKPGSVEDLASALRRLMGDKDLRCRFRAQCYPLLEEKQMFASKMADLYADLYRTNQTNPNG